MILFEKVSFEQFKKDLLRCLSQGEKREELTDEHIKSIYDKIPLPVRSTSGSAGYDFVTPISFSLDEMNSTVFIPTGIRAIMPENVVLMMYPRSGLGFKTGMMLANTVGVIDSDYQYAENEGHIMAKFVRGFQDIQVDQFDRVMQGVFLPYALTDNDVASGSRSGGLGSTGK